MFFFILFLYVSNAYAKEILEVCATYENTGKSYAVEAIILEGSELNSETNSFNYNSFSTYAVIFWSNEQASVIELDNFFGSIGIFGTNGNDQRGYPWKIVEGHTFCF